MNKMQAQVLEFHRRFAVAYNNEPTIPSLDVKELRVRLIQEEWKELYNAITKDDLIGVADGLADLTYVVMGTALAYGINLEAVFDEVHRSNLTKANPDGTVNYDRYGKVVKPPTYSPANIAKCLGVKLT